MRRSERTRRREAESTLRSRLRLRPLARLLVSGLLHVVRTTIRNRESARMDRARVAGITRDVLLELEQRLLANGLLEEPGDVHYLEEEELLDAVLSGPPAGGLRETVARRRRAEAFERTRSPIGRFFLTLGAPSAKVPQRIPAPRTTRREGDRTTLRGTGCAGGRIRARARIVLDPQEAGEVHGRILVAEMTDPGWVFLMTRASGLIVEKGSLLSHTAIIGRELGIPTIVGVSGATERLEEDDLLEIDGETGSIVRIAETGSPARVA